MKRLIISLAAAGLIAAPAVAAPAKPATTPTKSTKTMTTTNKAGTVKATTTVTTKVTPMAKKTKSKMKNHHSHALAKKSAGTTKASASMKSTTKKS